MPWIKVPTTLIGQIDAGIGIKVGFHYAGRKNLLGSFYPAEFVINSFEFIETLNRKKTECGVAEIVKIAMICDFELLKELVKLDEDFFEKIADRENKEQKKLFYEIVTRAGISILDLLKNDPYETEGKGRYFDFGHSFISGLENNGMSHGYAVAIEMLFSIILSYRNGWITEEYYRFLLDVFQKYHIIKPFCLRIFEKEYKKIRDTFVGPILIKRDGDLNFVVPIGHGKASFLNFDSCRTKEGNYIAVWSEEKFYREMDLAYANLLALAHIFE
jgi:3-dehydroquinate synthase